MQINHNGRETGLKRIIFLFLLLCMVIYSCKKKEKNSIPPTIEFIKDSGYVYSDTSAILGSVIKVGIKSSSLKANITYLNVLVDNGLVATALDSGMNTGFLIYTKEIIKDNSSLEKWIFTVMDRDRNKASHTLNLSKKPTITYGEIITYPQLTLGAQNNGTIGSFLSLTNGQVYNYEEAANNKELIDIIYYSDVYQATLSSPLENDAPTYFPGLTGWPIKNETKYDTTSVTPLEFDLANNDSLLLAEYDQVNGKRKAKFLAAGMVISFRTQSGKIGLVKVTAVNGTDAGTLNIAIKVQK